MKKMLVLAACFGMAAGFVACSDNNNDDPSAPGKATVSGPERNVWPETSVTLTATADGAESFVWYNGTAPVSGATATTYTVTVSGYYSAAGVNAVGEGPKSDPKAVDITTFTIGLTGDNANVCPEESVTLTASLSGAESFAWYLGETKLAATASTYSATVSGIYTVAGIIDGREGPKSGAIIVNITPCPAPAKATISGSTSNTCPAITVLLTASASGAASYEWYKNGSIIQGVTTNTYTVTASGNYTVAGVNNNGTGEISDVKTVTINADCPLSIDDLVGTWNGSEEYYGENGWTADAYENEITKVDNQTINLSNFAGSGLDLKATVAVVNNTLQVTVPSQEFGRMNDTTYIGVSALSSGTFSADFGVGFPPMPVTRTVDGLLKMNLLAPYGEPYSYFLWAANENHEYRGYYWYARNVIWIKQASSPGAPLKSPKATELKKNLLLNKSKAPFIEVQ
ncbi:MAG: immunoglobulin domain-containing protein [Prevotellaceae bacterium]|jgi:hypothetical protein|nr:immunoglobulin domain-containing protein [Prevotellaceae bacterium]